MFSPHQKMLRSLCIKSGGMLLRWEMSLWMKRIILMCCSWLNGLMFNLKFSESLMMDSKAQIFETVPLLRTSVLIQADDWQRMYLCMTSCWEDVVVCALGSLLLLNSLLKYLGLFLNRFKQHAYLEQPTSIQYSRSLWAPKVYLMQSCCGAFFLPYLCLYFEVVLC